ncbi:cytochrome P450, partial [bacterium]|nr:cytochrome P450 [bacterium]
LNAITIDNRAITHEEILGYCFVFFLAGLDTVVNALNYAVLYLARNPAVMQEIKGNPLLVDAFVEESLRRFSFVNTMRSTTQDTEFFWSEYEGRGACYPLWQCSEFGSQGF